MIDRTFARYSGFALFSAISLLGCSPVPRTEIVIVVSSDYAGSSVVRSVRVVAQRSGATTPMLDATYGLGDTRYSLPGELTLVAKNPDDTRALTVRVEGMIGSTPLVQEAVTRFQRERTLYLHMTLSSLCLGRTCPAGLTCRLGECAAPTQAPITEARPSPLLAGDASAPGTDVVDAAVGVDLVDASVATDATDALDAADAGDRDGAMDAGDRDGAMDAGDRDGAMDAGDRDGAMDAGDSPLASDVVVAADLQLQDLGSDIAASDATLDVVSSADATDVQAFSCDAGLADCGGRCVDLRVDPVNCGACGVACPAGALRCAAARCVTAEEVHLTSLPSYGTCVRFSDGTVRCWGSDWVVFGVGTSQFSSVTSPVLVDSLQGAQSLSLAGSHACFVGGDGVVRCWGSNRSFEAGTFSDGTPAGPASVDRPTPVMGLGIATAVSAGGFGNGISGHSCALLSDQTVRCWGNGPSYGDARGAPTQVVAPGGLPPVLGVHAGGNHTCALLENRSLRCWGNNFQGQVSSVMLNSVESPTPAGVGTHARAAAGDNATCAIASDGAVYCWGAAPLGDGVGRSPRRIPGVSGARDLCVGSGQACAIRGDGTPVCWGSLSEALFGTPPRNDRGPEWPSPVAVQGVPRAHRIACAKSESLATGCIVAEDRSVWCWGAGYLGDGRPLSIDRRVEQVSGVAEVASICAGFTHGCAALRDGRVLCWGYSATGAHGESGTASRLTPTVVAAVSTADQVVCGEAFSCARSTDGSVRCWGSNELRAVAPDNPSTGALPPTVVLSSGASRVRAGQVHACAVAADGTVRCWGANSAGQLGVGNALPITTPTAVTGLPPAVDVALTRQGTCAITRTGQLWCWGRIGSVNSSTPVLVPEVTDARDIRCGEAGCCAITSANARYCWGVLPYGLVGANQGTPSPTRTTRFALASLLFPGAPLYAQMPDGTVSEYIWDGANGTEQQVEGISSIREISCGANSQCCGIRSDGHALCWGTNQYGQLGNGVSSVSPVRIRF